MHSRTIERIFLQKLQRLLLTLTEEKSLQNAVISSKSNGCLLSAAVQTSEAGNSMHYRVTTLILIPTVARPHQTLKHSVATDCLVTGHFGTKYKTLRTRTTIPTSHSSTGD